MQNSALKKYMNASLPLLKDLEELESLQNQLNLSRARTNLLDFIKHVWWYPDDLVIGRHTQAIADRLTKAVEDFREGKSTYLLIQVPYRHGKSDLVSRALPTWFAGALQDREPNVIASAYGAGLSEGFSKDCKRIIRSERYAEVFPSISIERGSDNISEWAIEESTGRMNFVGLGGSVTGKGAHLLNIDDYCKNREQARSLTIRDKVWDAFRIDLMSRLAPTHVVNITATPWHIDDLAGRLVNEMAENPDFPRFEILRFPARNDDGTFLFPELYSDEWYRNQYALQGSLAGANLDCDPTTEGGNRFNVSGIQIHNSLDDFPEGRYVRAIDLASTAKERGKRDPDYTVAMLGLGRKVGGVPEIWIKDAPHIQADAPRRDAMLDALADTDDSGISWALEAFGGYKDTYTLFRSKLRGKRIVRASRLSGDKEVKAAPLESIFDAGNIHILRAPWNDLFIKQFTEFPDGGHDDFVDTTAIIYHETIGKGGGRAYV